MARNSTARKGLALVVALAAIAVSFIAGTGSSATAAQGEVVVSGVLNTSTAVTQLINTTSGLGERGVFAAGSGIGLHGRSTAAGYGVAGDVGAGGVGVYGTTVNLTNCCGGYAGDGVHGDGWDNGVSGATSNNAASGVYGQSNGGGYGVAGRSTTGVGVLGEALGAADGVDGLANNSCCSAVYGLNSGTGNGVAGRSDTGTGVLAASSGGIGLKVDGKAQFSRSGTATVTGTSTTPKSSIRVSNVALTSKSLVLTTPQKNVAGVWIQAAVPNVANSYVTIYLNKAVTVSYPVAWFIVEKP